jgi:hypothetical protein
MAETVAVGEDWGLARGIAPVPVDGVADGLATGACMRDLDGIGYPR